MVSVAKSLLDISSLSVGYRRRAQTTTLFRKLNLSLRAGEMVCLMGPNGIGKSSLLRTLAGLQNPLEGNILLNALSSPGDASRAISVVLTDRISGGDATVEELVSFGRYPHLGWHLRFGEEDHTQVQAAMTKAGIRQLGSKKLSQLSDGQLQMALIARALAQNTPVILLDEPTAHLDLNNRVEIMNLLRQLAHQSGKAILVSTHEIDLALQTADLIWLAGRDESIVTGIPEDLVLDGSFDSVFQLKGFDLKSGKLLHTPARGVTLALQGTGPEFLWTKNALERSGFQVTAIDDAKVHPLAVWIEFEASRPRWILKKGDRLFTTGSLAELIRSL